MAKVITGGIPTYFPNADLVVLPGKEYEGPPRQWTKKLASSHEIGHWKDKRSTGAVYLTEDSTGRERIQDELNAWIHQISRRGVTDEDKEYLDLIRQDAINSDITEEEFVDILNKAVRRYDAK